VSLFGLAAANESPVTVAPLTPDQPSALQAFLLKQMVGIRAHTE